MSQEARHEKMGKWNNIQIEIMLTDVTSNESKVSISACWLSRGRFELALWISEER